MKKYSILLLNILLSGCYVASPVGYQDVYDDAGGTVVYVDSPTSVYTTPAYVTTPQTNVIYTTSQVTYVSPEPEIVYYNSPFYTPPHRPVRPAPHFKPVSPHKHNGYAPHGGSIKPHAGPAVHDVHVKKPTGNPVRNAHHNKTPHHK